MISLRSAVLAIEQAAALLGSFADACGERMTEGIGAFVRPLEGISAGAIGWLAERRRIALPVLAGSAAAILLAGAAFAAVALYRRLAATLRLVGKSGARLAETLRVETSGLRRGGFAGVVDKLLSEAAVAALDWI